MAALTANLNLYKPAVDSAVDEDLWGGQLNDNMDTLDSEAATKTINQSFADKELSRPELKDYAESLQTPSSSSGTLTADFENGNHVETTLTENVTTLTINNPPATGRVGLMMFKFKQDGTGGWAVTWPSAIKWAGGTAPVITTTASRTDIITIITYDGGTTYAGAIVGQNYTGL